jgi:hypothetical protein
MLPNASLETDIAHARRFYLSEIAEIFSGLALALTSFARETVTPSHQTHASAAEVRKCSWPN